MLWPLLLQVPPDAGAPASCVAVTFDCFTARLGGLPEARLSLAWLSPLGFVDALYLDEDTRVSVGDKGGLFVLRRVAGEAVGAAKMKRSLSCRYEDTQGE